MGGEKRWLLEEGRRQVEPSLNRKEKGSISELRLLRPITNALPLVELNERTGVPTNPIFSH